jgi:hypothetical protein
MVDHAVILQAVGVSQVAGPFQLTPTDFQALRFSKAERSKILLALF